jgi:hypothetical protein
MITIKGFALEIFCAAGLFASMATASAQICPPNVAPTDGCTTYGAQFLFPDIGAFRPVFTPSCERHDRCYTTLGTGYQECNSTFAADLGNACRARFSAYFDPVMRALCLDTATRYVAAVAGYAVTNNPLLESHRGALDRSRATQLQIDSEQCGTTPERSALFAPNLIGVVNNRFLINARRLPTVYEFFAAINASSGDKNLVSDYSFWETMLLPGVADSANGKEAPAVGYNKTVYAETLYLNANPVLLPNTDPGARYSYRWKLASGSSNTPSFSQPPIYPMWDFTHQVKGFLRILDTQTGVRNLVLIEEAYVERGSCAPQPGPDIHCQ